jgi:sterol desaturase/sphingolipid hydroxylase (fatty acid hydroxylase superfamily)
LSVDIALMAVLLSAAYLLFFGLERARRLRRAKAPLLPRLLVNIALSAITFGTAAALVQPAAGAMLGYTEGRALGLVPLLGLGSAGEIAVAFLLLDLTFYYWHVANHRFALLWRFHNVHHIDPDLDVSTAFRFHFVEVGLSAGFRAAQVLIIGPSLVVYVAYDLVFQLATLFHHSNIRLPVSLERALNVLIVTPRMHGIHHSIVRHETDSNWGTIFSWWDRLHQTLRVDLPQEQIEIGVAPYRDESELTVARLWIMPFQAQREWRLPGGEVPVRNAEDL